MQPIKRDAKSELYECAKYAHKLLINSNRFPSKKIGRRPHYKMLVMSNGLLASTYDDCKTVREEARDANHEDTPPKTTVEIIVRDAKLF